IDAQAQEQHLSVSERDQLRLQKARPILESIKNQIQAARSQTLPKSALAKACNYTLTLWHRLTRFLDHPVLELSTNAAENAIRPVALGRKNWIHFGSQEAGPRIAAISLLSCQASRSCPLATSPNSPQRPGWRQTN